jgi:putative membrane protein
MSDNIRNSDIQRGNISDHLANERTFLAWIRTSIGIMAFGFVVVKFTLFVKQLSIVLQKPLPVQSHGYSAAIGILLVGFGSLTGLLAFLRYRTVGKQLININYRPSTFLTTLLAICILVFGLFLLIYLFRSV